MDNTLQIGSLKINSKVIIAPMAGVSNNAFKEVLREMTDGLITTEMVSDKAILHGNDKTLEMVKFSKDKYPIALQLFGSEPETMAKAAKFLEENTNCHLIDINMGCPAPKIVKNMSGSKILLDSQKVYEIAKAVKDAVSLPVTVKMRIGWDEKHINAIENAKMIEKAGIDAIFIHGRTTKQMYSGKANWDIIKQVKESVNIPVIGNGDIDSPQMAMEYLQKYNVDGIMIGRKALGNPWIIKQTDYYFKTGKLMEDPTLGDKIKMIQVHLDKLVDLKGQRVAINEMRGHASWYLKGVRGANVYKKKLQQITTLEEFEGCLEELKEIDL